MKEGDFWNGYKYVFWCWECQSKNYSDTELEKCEFCGQDRFTVHINGVGTEYKNIKGVK